MKPGSRLDPVRSLDDSAARPELTRSRSPQTFIPNSTTRSSESSGTPPGSVADARGST
jgi:hypothetical protein